MRRFGRIAASLHADTPQEVSAQLLGPAVGADEANLAGIDLLAFMVRAGGRRRVSAIYESLGGEVPRWNRTVIRRPADDRFVLKPLEPPARLAEATELMVALTAQDTRTLEEIMGAVAGFYAR